MSDITTIFGLLLILGLGLPGLLTTWWLLFPKAVWRARVRVEHTPWKTFFLGTIGVFLWAVPVTILLALPGGPAKMLGAGFILFGLTFATLGGAGIASLMGDRLNKFAAEGSSQAALFVRGAVALELAAAVPILGWFIFLPLALIASMGASIFSLLHWTPRLAPASETATPVNEPAPQSA